MKAPLLLILSLPALSGCVGVTKARSGPGEDSDGRPVQYVTPEQMAHMTQVERDAMHAATGGTATYYPGRPGYDPTPYPPLTTEELNKAMAVEKEQQAK